MHTDIRTRLKNFFGTRYFNFIIQVFKRGETFHTELEHTVLADNLEQAKAMVLTYCNYSEDEYIISFEKMSGYTQMTVIEKDIPPAVSHISALRS